MFVAVSAAVGLVFAGSFLHDMRTLTTRLTLHQLGSLRAMSPVVVSLIEQSMEHGSPEHIGELFRVLAERPQAGAAELLDAQGRLVDLADIRGPRSAAPAPPPGSIVYEVPIEAKPSCARCHGVSSGRLGTLRLLASDAERAQLRRSLVRSRLAMACAGTLVVALASLAIVRFLVHAPLGSVTAAMREVGQGRFEARVEGRLPGELQVIADGFNTMVSEIARDRGEIVELHRKQLGQADRLAALGSLAAQLAHEVRNPLTGLSSALQVLQREAEAGSPRRGLIDKMLLQLQRMDRTMGDFLRYARLPEAAPRPFALKDALSRVLFLVGPRMKAQKVELRLQVPESLPRLMGDPGQLEQAFLNLCLNAVQAMGEGGVLEVAAAPHGDSEVLVTVRDTGPGIAPGELERVFEPFFTTKDGGSGLGLPITRQIVLAHGGELWLESDPESGTTASVRLPRAKEAA
ncbi:MAG: HAMP domain-containing protein [Elusimicrobia bacterium]|nr:HAMP domain-containing protein [Elusimicrobiota bacterium]